MTESYFRNISFVELRYIKRTTVKGSNYLGGCRYITMVQKRSRAEALIQTSNKLLEKISVFFQYSYLILPFLSSIALFISGNFFFALLFLIA